MVVCLRVHICGERISEDLMWYFDNENNASRRSLL